MSDREQNISIVKQIYAAFAERNISAILNLLSTEVIWGEPKNPYNPAAGIRFGHAGFIEWLNIGKQSEEIIALQPQKFLTDEDSVAVVGYTKCLAKPTGKSYETDFVHLVTIKDGRVVRFQEFFDTYSAGEAFRK